MADSYKAVGLLSGGLDSTLACAVLKEQGIEVHAVFFEMPWGCGNRSRIYELASQLGVALKVLPLTDDYLDVLRSPKYGYGSAFNPCVDCHIYMVRKAADYMREIGAAFVFTGEVIGQRPMSQRRQCLQWVEESAGLKGLLLRPLCAQRLEPTIPETSGMVDRSRLLAIDGRSRKIQQEMAQRLGLTGFGQPGGGCLLTEQHFTGRFRDALDHGIRTIHETAILGLGRYFRVDRGAFVVVGRDEHENEKIVQYALQGDTLLRAEDFPGPVAVLRTAGGPSDLLPLAAGLVQFHSKWRDKDPQNVACWVKGEEATPRAIPAAKLNSAQVRAMIL